MRLDIAFETGWSLEYIDNLGVRDISDISGKWSGEAKVAEFKNSHKR